MDADALRARIDRDLVRCGQSLIAVMPEPPGRVGWTYSIGLSGHGLPELVTFGLPPDAAEAVLNGVAERIRAGQPGPEPGMVLSDVVAVDLRLGSVLDLWQPTLIPLALDWAEGPVRALQVEWPDEHGRWPDDPQGCPDCAGSQPWLSSDDPWWPRTVAHPRPAGEPTEVVYAPILDLDGEWTGEWEALPASPAGQGRVRIEAVPFHRVGCTFGDVVGTAWEPCRDGVRREVTGRVGRPQRLTVRLRLIPGDDLTRDPRGTLPLLDAFARLKEHPHELDDPDQPSAYVVAIPRHDREALDAAALLAARGLLEYR